MSKAKTKHLYSAIKNAQQQSFTPKDGQCLQHLLKSFKWLKHAKLNNKTKESCWKLLHRKLYTEENDGGIAIIYLSSFSNKVWDLVNKAWYKWTKQQLTTSQKFIFNFNSKYSYAENTLTAITIRELYRTHWNHKLNKIELNTKISIHNIKKELKLTLKVALSYSPTMARKVLSLDYCWLTKNLKLNKLSLKELGIT